MESLLHLYICFLFIPPSIYSNNLTYVFTHIPSSNISTLFRSNGLLLLNTSAVQRLSSLNSALLTSTSTILSANNIQSIVFSWNTGDCSYPSSLAAYVPTITIINPICLTSNLALSNQIQLIATSDQLANAAVIFMTRSSLHYFSMIVTDSNSFLLSFGQQFASYLSEASFIYERLISASNFSSSTVTSLKSRSKCHKMNSTRISHICPFSLFYSLFIYG